MSPALLRPGACRVTIPASSYQAVGEAAWAIPW